MDTIVVPQPIRDDLCYLAKVRGTIARNRRLWGTVSVGWLAKEAEYVTRLQQAVARLRRYANCNPDSRVGLRVAALATYIESQF